MEEELVMSQADGRREGGVLAMVTFGVVCGKGHGAANGFRPPVELMDATESERFLVLVSESDGLEEREMEGTRAPSRIMRIVSPDQLTVWLLSPTEDEAMRSALPATPSALNGLGLAKSISMGTAASPGVDW